MLARTSNYKAVIKPRKPIRTGVLPTDIRNLAMYRASIRRYYLAKLRG